MPVDLKSRLAVTPAFGLIEVRPLRLGAAVLVAQAPTRTHEQPPQDGNGDDGKCEYFHSRFLVGVIGGRARKFWTRLIADERRGQAFGYLLP